MVVPMLSTATTAFIRSLAWSSAADTVAGVIEQLRFREEPDANGDDVPPGGLRFDAHSHWLFGVKLDADESKE